MAEKESGISKSDFEDLLGALEDIAEAMNKSRTVEPPVINVPAGPAPVVNAAPVTVKPPQVTVNAPTHPYAGGMRVRVERDRFGNASEYTIYPI